MRMLSAISFGVFRRSAPSTSAIIRSRNVSPGFDAMRTLIQSDSTRVPPVTALRSPPDSRMTGALSPVMTDSSTEATPSMTSPSPGMVSNASQSTTSPTRSADAGMASVAPDAAIRLAITSVLDFLSDSAWALPRASAIASAKVAKNAVNHSHAVICTSKPRPGRRRTASDATKTVVSKAPTSTTKMTGFRQS